MKRGVNILKKYFFPLVIGGVFFWLYSYLLIGNQARIFSWPDEMSNYAFIQSFADGLEFSIEEPRNLIAGDIITPRSTRVVDHDLRPIGFLGLPMIYGFFASFMPDWWVVFFTPLLALAGAWFLYLLVSRHVGKEVGVISALLLLLTPAYFYYSTFALLPNIALCSFLIIGTYFFDRAIISLQQYRYFLGSGFFIGLALMIRPSEIIWITPILLGLGLYFIKKIKWKFYAVFSAPLGFLALIYLYFNQKTYSSALASGYTDTFDGGSLFFPFGFSTAVAVKNLLTYVILPQWYFFTLLILGVVGVLFYQSNKTKRIYVLIYSLVSLFLILYYCSWQLSDQLILNLSRLGVSYNRYLLPIFIAGIPLIAIYLHQLYRAKNNLLKNLGVLLAVIFVAFSLKTVYFNGHDNLINIKKSIEENAILQTQVLSQTPAHAIILTERGDKFIFPHRAIISQVSEEILAGVDSLITSGYPVYYLNYGESILSGLKVGPRDDLGFNYNLYEVQLR